MSRYSDAGVDIDSADKFVEEIKVLASSTANKGVVSNIGGFGAAFDPFVGRKKYSSPILVSSTDGVGTKLLIAQEVSNHKTIGIDLVAMCVNDVLTQGAEPMFFLDYFATGSLDRETAVEVVSGIVEGCKQANISLVGGETAEMPGMYSREHYDLAGFAVGLVEKSEMLPHTNQLCVGDLVIGLSSTGLHSNGFSLVRKVFKDLSIDYHSTCHPLPASTWADVLLEPTKIYVSSVLPVLHMVKALAHITGGGFIHNIPRVLPLHLAVEIQLCTWKKHCVFEWLEEEAKIPQEEMFETFNCGIGMVLIAAAEKIPELLSILNAPGETAYLIGKVVQRGSDGSVVLCSQ